MPKMKTKSGAKKRFSLTATGKVKMNPSRKRHGLINRPQKMKRQHRGIEIMARPDAKKVAQILPAERLRRLDHGTRQTGRHHPRPSQEDRRHGGTAIAAAPRRNFRIAIEKVEKGLRYAYRDRRNQQARLPRPVDPAHQRRRPRARPDLFAVHQRHQAGGHRASTARSWPISPSASPRPSRPWSSRPRRPSPRPPEPARVGRGVARLAFILLTSAWPAARATAATSRR